MAGTISASKRDALEITLLHPFSHGAGRGAQGQGCSEQDEEAAQCAELWASEVVKYADDHRLAA